jgi:hypothetical protein
MRKALVLVIMAVLAAACGKKQPPASPQPTTPGESKGADEAGEEKESDSAPTMRKSDPDEGGE